MKKPAKKAKPSPRNRTHTRTRAREGTALVRKALTDEQALFVAAQMERRTERQKAGFPPSFIDKPTEEGMRAAPDPEANQDLWFARLAAATGATDERSAIKLVSQINEVVTQKTSLPAGALEGSLGLMLDIAPRDGLEGMLAAQMVTTHDMAMRMLRSSMASEGDFFVKHSERLMRLFTLQLDALNRHRGRGPSEQRVTVEHVHVHEGGQAVVGNVTAKAGGGG